MIRIGITGLGWQGKQTPATAIRSAAEEGQTITL